MAVMTTRKLYYDDAYIREFDAIVTSCREVPDKGYSVSLNRTAFYPEGGGQPGDIGVIMGGGPPGAALETMVIDTQLGVDGDIFHFMREPLPPGATVHCSIDWPRRIDLMRRHTGEHIVSGLINRLYGLNNVGFHMSMGPGLGAAAGAIVNFVTIDTSGPLEYDQVSEVERLANKAVFDDIPVTASFPEPSELANMKYRSKKELSGDVRIVSIPGIDACACCGLHVGRTLEAGIIKITSWERYKGGTRLYMLCGPEAAADYAAKNAEIYRISAMLSAKPGTVADAVKRLLDENGKAAYDLSRAKAEITQLLAEKRLESLQADGHIQKSACVFEDEREFIDLPMYAGLLAEKVETAAIFMRSGPDDSNCGCRYRYAIASKNGGASAAAKALNAAFNGRGGGNGGLAQGSVIGAEEDIRSFCMSVNE